MLRQTFAKTIFSGLKLSLVLVGLIGAPQVFGKSCTYQIKEDAAKLIWKGYKFTEKKAVSGSFDKISWSQNKKATSLKSLIESISWEIDPASVNSGDKTRDFTLASKFFGIMISASKISGNVKSYDPKKDTSVAVISMNGVSTEVAFKVAADNNSLKNSLIWSGQLKLSDQFQMVASVNSLAEACKVLHTGTDGKAVTWDEVGLEIVATYEEICK